ncbi:hypothetical protein G9A89_017437 [Geosiphon pyriformis]|nr:hypothetical protein G9A89_017437 [Geosiphon pyriformis]
MGLLFDPTSQIVTLAESKNIRANHLRFMKSLFQHYCQHLELTYNHISAESAFNFYVNKKIAYLLETSVNIKLVRETFYNELIQNTSLPTNHNFVSIITEINKEIEHHTQQRYPITYTSKDKEKLQTPAVTPQRIQPPTWKKTRVELPNNPSYYYTPRSAINISSTDVSTSNMTSAFGRFTFQSKQKKEDLLGLYSEYFEGFKSLITNAIRILITATSTEFQNRKQEIEEKKSEDQEFTYQNPILENPEIKTPNFQTQSNLDNSENNILNIQTPSNQNNPNSKIINQHLPPVIIINQPPVELIGQPIQPPNQQNQQPPPQQQMTYVLIAKLDKFNSKEDDAQVWLNDVAKAITANNWDNARAMQVIPYFFQDTADA